MLRLGLVAVGLALGACMSLDAVAPEDGPDALAGGAGGTGAASGVGGSSADAALGGSGGAPFDAAPPDAFADAPFSDGNPCSPLSPKLLDDFGLPNGVIGSAWLGDRNSFGIVGGRLRHIKSNQDDRILYDKPFCSAQSASVRLMKLDSFVGLMGLVFAKGTNQDCELVQVGYSALAGGLRVERCSNNKWNDLGSQAFTVLEGDTLSARIDSSGKLTAAVNGTDVLSVPVGVWPGGRAGIAIYFGGTTLELDDFKGG
ncbi:MAG: hypothetical protein IT375_03275 [Polyangiaceae bacterium]|nr:hypothetical protein [Polyangiaceae bacterium]